MDERDFAAYAAARRASLVRSGVFLGCSFEDTVYFDSGSNSTLLRPSVPSNGA